LSAPWWAAFPAAEAQIRCGAGEHRLRWAEGRLIAAQHPDAEGERVLAALGGEEAECVTMTEAWRAHRDDLDVLALGPRSPADVLTVPPLVTSHRAAAAIARPPSQRPGPAEAQRARARGAELLSVFALGPAFQHRLSGSVAAAWSPGGPRAGDQASVRPVLVAALAGRLAPAVGGWLGIDADQVTASLHEDAGWGSIQQGGTGPGSRLHASLPSGWLARVWAAGLAVLGRHLVVDVLDVTWPQARLLGVPRPGAEPAVLTARHDGEHWSVKREEQT
jgi:hypothetical protein